MSLPSLTGTQPLLLSLLALPALFIFKRILFPSSSSAAAAAAAVPDSNDSNDSSEEKDESKGVMQPEDPELDPPSDKPFTLEELKPFDGNDPSKPIYVSIKGTVFDVTKKREMYGPGKSYNIFAGKDGSRGLGMSSLNDEDAVPDYSTLPTSEMKVLNDWHAFFSKRYNIVGRVVDLPEAVAGR